MKKIILAVLMFMVIIAFQNTSQAQQEVGIGEVIFADTADTITPQGFLINELSYDAVKLHLSIAEKNIDEKNYEGEVLATVKKLEELTKTDIIEVLNVSVNKEQALTQYLTDCDQQLQK